MLEMFDAVDDYFDKANKRKTAQNTEKLVVLQKLELAQKTNDKAAEAAAQSKIEQLDRISKRTDKIDSFAAIVFLIIILVFGGIILWLFSPLIKVFFE